MAQILWKGGKEPPDPVVSKDKSQPFATYTGPIEETAKVDEAEGPVSDRGQMTSDRLGEILARASEGLAQRLKKTDEQLARQVKEGGSSNKQQSQVAQPVRPEGVVVRNVAISAGIYSLAKRRQALGMDNAEQPLIIASGGRQMPILMSLAAMSPAAPVVESSELEHKEAQIIPLRFPLSEEQRKSEELCQKTGMTLEAFRELVAPGWTIAEMISPRENARRVKLGICNLWYDTELAALKAKHAVRDFLYKKRPFPEEPAPEVT